MTAVGLGDPRPRPLRCATRDASPALIHGEQDPGAPTPGRIPAWVPPCSADVPAPGVPRSCLARSESGQLSCNSTHRSPGGDGGDAMSGAAGELSVPELERAPVRLVLKCIAEAERTDLICETTRSRRESFRHASVSRSGPMAAGNEIRSAASGRIVTARRLPFQYPMVVIPRIADKRSPTWRKPGNLASSAGHDWPRGTAATWVILGRSRRAAGTSGRCRAVGRRGTRSRASSRSA